MTSPPSLDRLRVTSGQFRDFDAFAEAARAWDLESLQLDQGRFRSDMMQASLGPVHLAYAGFNRTLEMHGEPPRNLRTIVLLSERSPTWWWRGRERPEHAIMVYPMGAEIATVSRPGYEGYALSVTEEHLADVALAAGVPSPDDLFRQREVFQCDPTDMTALRLRLRSCLSMLAHLPATPQDQVRRELEFLLPADILRAIAQSPLDERDADPGFRSVAVNRVLQYVSAFPRQPLTVADVCRVAGASERTIQMGFLERFGLRPKAYLRDRRLNGVRHALASGDPETTVIHRVAKEWGFWHMGQFARDYRRLFDELPSDTVQRTRRGT